MVVGVLCLLGKGRLRDFADWGKQVLPLLKPALQRELLDFDAGRQGEGEETRWSDSMKATEGLTSDDIQRKASLAVQTMLKWLEVNRLTRHEGIAAAVAKLSDRQA